VTSGDVDQSNEAANAAAVGNVNDTDQSVDQSQTGDATADGGNADGGGDAGDGSAVVEQGQAAGVSNGTDQSGDASVDNYQSNINLPVAVLSPGANGGNVDQSNTADNSATVINANSTDQSVGQSQTGDATANGGDADGSDDNGCDECSSDQGGDAGDGDAVVVQDQSADVDNATDQGGDATVDSDQENVNEPAYQGEHNSENCECESDEPVTSGDVDQSNEAANAAAVGNVNDTDQSVDQSQTGAATANGGNASGSDDNGCGCEVDTFKGGDDNGCDECSDGQGGDAGDGNAVVVQDQSADVANSTSQGGSATVDNAQENTNGAAGSASVRKGGDDCGCEPEQPSMTGDVDQSNTADNSAVVANGNSTDQSVDQSQTGDATASGGNADGRDEDSCGCEPTFTTFRGGGDDQPCGCESDDTDGDAGDGTAVVDQDQSADVSNGTDQSGTAAVDNDQENVNSGFGDVEQSNVATNRAKVLNGNGTAQAALQRQLATALGHAA